MLVQFSHIPKVGTSQHFHQVAAHTERKHEMLHHIIHTESCKDNYKSHTAVRTGHTKCHLGPCMYAELHEKCNRKSDYYCYIII